MSKETLGIVVVAIVAFVSLNDGFLESVPRTSPCLKCENVTNITEECIDYTHKCRACFLERKTYNNIYYYTLGCADNQPQASCPIKTRRSLEDIMAVSRYDRRNNRAAFRSPTITQTTATSVTTTALTRQSSEPVVEEGCCQSCTNTREEQICNANLYECQPGACYDEIGSHGCQIQKYLDHDYCNNKTNAKKTCKLSCQLCDLDAVPVLKLG
ncbi:uncharacterized protein LOC128241846 isoform X2 [Mya arenaria]|uniref:uncharacterized protein LOC128241846 isoform X2 n=1 Tax=Mya arenaria TaxID=6604 RepID=UPI0022E86F94|nr:uncharacterized protein LOC128241846 isoform X2 [Mya arenaria]